MEEADTRRNEELLVSSGRNAGDFVVLYDRLMPGLLRFFVRRTFDAQIAADLTAETLADAFACRRRYRDRGEGSAAGWLYTIARRKLGRFEKRRRVEDKARRRLGLERLVLEPDDIERVEALIDFEEVGSAVAAAFNDLEAGHREAVRLRVIEGRSYRDLAAELGCTEETARARVSRGLKRLAAELDA